MSDRFGARGSGGGNAFSRRRLLGAAGGVGLVAAGTAGFVALNGDDDGSRERGTARVTAPPPEGVLGANFNGDPSGMDFSQLREVSATWLRGFFAMPDAGKGPPADRPVIRTLLTASGRGYGTVLSLKFPFTRRPLPAAGSAALTAELERLDKVLPIVLDRVDILAIGNEPFIETRMEDRDARLNVFYETVARHVIAYRAEHFGNRCRTRLYMGALNRLDLPRGRTPAVERWMGFVRDTPSIEGVDIHPHLPSPGAGQRYLDYVLPRMRPEQRFLATEFSLVLLWKKHLSDLVPDAFAERYPGHRGMPVWMVVRNAIDQPFTQRKWDDFLAACPWFQAGKDFLRDQVEGFRRTGRLAVATYGVAQDAAMVRDFGPESTPWLFNSLFCPYTVLPGTGGLPGRNRTWTDAFRALQRT
ncbi:hypothetical protein [Actinomadura sp. 9N407]|uniref:hypothetical protein n=1 Tax=Actinomadura sp. 9N407 TaxID=3375154 RepID=UPI0037B8F3F0